MDTVFVTKDNFNSQYPWKVKVVFPNGTSQFDGPYRTKADAEEAANIHRIFTEFGDILRTA